MARWPFSKRNRRSTIESNLHESAPPLPINVSENRNDQSFRDASRLASQSHAASPSSHLSDLKTSTSRHYASPAGGLDQSNAHNMFSAAARIPLQNESAEDITALPNTQQLRTSPHLRPARKNDADIPYDFRLYTAAVTQKDKFEITEKINPKENAKKRPDSKKENKLAKSPSNRTPFSVREEDFRSMSAPTAMPRRLAGDDGILRRESKVMREGLNRSFSRPVSSISLPRPDTGRSNPTAYPEGRSYRISTIDMLMPRPIVRPQGPPPSAAATTTAVLNSPAVSHGPSVRAIQTLGKHPLQSTSKLKRIDDLADEMNSADIRTILQRDAALKDNKRTRDAEKLRKKLERRAEKMRLEESGDEAGGASSSPLQERATTKSRARSSRNRSKAKATNWAAPLPGDTFYDPFSDALEVRIDQVVVTSTNADGPFSDQVIRRPLSIEKNLSAGAKASSSSSPPPPSFVHCSVTPKLASKPLRNHVQASDLLKNYDTDGGYQPHVFHGTHYIEESADEEDFHDAVSTGSITNASRNPPGISQTISMSNDEHAKLEQTRMRLPSPVIDRNKEHKNMQSPEQDSKEDEEPELRNLRRLSFDFTRALPPHRIRSSTTSQYLTALPIIPASLIPEQKKKWPGAFFSFLRLGDKLKSRRRSQSLKDDEATNSFVSARPRTTRDVIINTQPPNSLNGQRISTHSVTPSQLRSKFHNKDNKNMGMGMADSAQSQAPSHTLFRGSSPSFPLSPFHIPSPTTFQLNSYLPIPMPSMDMPPLSPSSATYGIDKTSDKRSKSVSRQGNPFTQSLASVDSEGSWLTGKPVKRMVSNRSGPSYRMEEAGETAPSEEDELGSYEYLRKIANTFDDETSTFLGHGDVAKNAQMKSGLRVKSSKGLLRLQDNSNDNTPEQLTPTPTMKDYNRHDSTMPDVEQLNLDLTDNSSESDMPKIEEATSVRASKIYDAKVVDVSRRNSRVLSI